MYHRDCCDTIKTVWPGLTKLFGTCGLAGEDIMI